MGEIINANDIKNDVNKMKDYLKDIYTLEKELYCSQRAQNKTVNIINGLGIEQKIERPLEDSYFAIFASNLIGMIIFAGIGAFIGYFIGFLIVDMLDVDFGFLGYYEFYIFIGTIPAIVMAILSIKQGIEDNKYKVRKYNEEVEQDKERVKRELDLVPTYRNNESLYSQNVRSCQESLNQLYSLDIIFPKYRNFVAIAQIYEYYMSGRCTELEGHEGAYNIFESELRQNVIIAQLNDVLANLEEIRRTQYMIYDAICFANSQLAQIESNTAAIAYNTSVTAENTAIIARYRHVR